jgi:ATP-dependent Clp protease ATP-binding subunit ClpC
MDYSPAAQSVFSLGIYEANGLGSTMLEPEHLWLGVLKAEDILYFANEDMKGISPHDIDAIKDEIAELAGRFRKAGFNCRQARRRFRKIIKDTQKNIGPFSGHRSSRCREIFDQAMQIAQIRKSENIRIIHFVLAILLQGSSDLEILLAEFGSSKKDLLMAMGWDGDKQNTKPAESPNVMDRKELKGSKTPLLDTLGRDLVDLAGKGLIDPVIGRDEEIKKIARILVQKKKNNPILVGDAGVGKTCVVEGLALKCSDPNAPPFLKKLKIYEITMGSLVAGTMHRGDFESRLEQLINEASSDPDIIIFIDEIHTMMGAGAGSEGAMDAANILKPALSRGTIKCIGATTTDEYRRYIEKDQALERRFQVVWIDEPGLNEAIAMLKGLKEGFEAHHGVSITDQAIEAAVDLSIRHLIDFRLPDKAIDIIDQACARAILKSLSFIGAQGEGGTGIKIDVIDVARVIAERARIPLDTLTTEDSTRLLNMEDALRKRVIGQDSAIKQVCEAVRTARAGLHDPRRPMGVFLFLGSTGTGKTELAKALSEFLFFDVKKLIRFDMSEYQEKNTISRLLGAPPSYIGYDEEGQLSKAVRTNPYSVILFDEVEKAHPDILNMFLQIFDEGMVTDTRGRKINFRETIIILTSNIGANHAMSVRPQIGFITEQNHNQEQNNQTTAESRNLFMNDNTGEQEQRYNYYRRKILDEVHYTLTPELLNRIQNTIIFYPLDRNTVRKIIEKHIDEINKRLSGKKITIRLTGQAVEFLLVKGYSEKFGAREMERTIEHHIVQPVSVEIIKGKIINGDTVDVGVNTTGEGLMFS